MYVEKGREKMYPKLSWLSGIIKLGMIFKMSLHLSMCYLFCVIRTYFLENKKLPHSISSHADISISTSQ